MSSRHLVDPELAPLVDLQGRIPLNAERLAEARAGLSTMFPQATAPAPGVTVTEVRVPGRDGAPDVRLLVSAPSDDPPSGGGVFHVHGGGFVMGAAEMTLATDATYVRAFGAVVVSVDYRLAPETPYPGPLEDCYAGLSWLFEHAAGLGIDPGRICVTGESSGGGLAAALVLLTRSRGEYSIAFQHLVFPMLDDRTVVDPNPSPFIGEFTWTRERNRFGWASLLGKEPGSADVSAFAAPARATDFSALPPTFIVCGAIDLFLEENLEYARRLIRAGVPTELHIYPGAPHAFQMIEEANVTKACTRDSMNALKRALTKS